MDVRPRNLGNTLQQQQQQQQQLKTISAGNLLSTKPFSILIHLFLSSRGRTHDWHVQGPEINSCHHMALLCSSAGSDLAPHT